MTYSRARSRGHLDGLGIEIAELANRTGITETRCADLMYGPIAPTDEEIAQLAVVFGFEPESLHSQGGEWEKEYVEAVLLHAAPMSYEDIQVAAEALRGVDRYAAPVD
jgi:hypothetical protein